MSGIRTSRGPSDAVLRAFGTAEGPVRLSGGIGSTWATSSVVLIPVDDVAEASWVADLASRIEPRGFRLAQPVPAGECVAITYSCSGVKRPSQFVRCPIPLRNAARSKRDAEAAHTLSVAIAEAVLPIHVKMVFLFDGDERKEEVMQQVRKVTEGRASFLEVREIENCLLSPKALHSDIASQCDLLGLPTPSLDDVHAELDRLLGDVGSADLYPRGARQPIQLG